jgi:hypothetical protein
MLSCMRVYARRPGLPGSRLVAGTVARRWSRAKARARSMARVCSHVRESWNPRAAAWSCRTRGTGIPGPRHDATAKGDCGCGGAEAVRWVPAQEAAQRPDGRGSPRVGYRGFIGGAGSRGKRKVRQRRRSPRARWRGGCDAVVGQRRWVEAVQGAQLRRCRRSGAGLAELRRRWPSPPRAAPSPPLLLVQRRWEGEAGRLGFGSAARALIPGARFWERLRPGVLDGRAGTRGGIAAARASRACAAVKARWKRGRGRLRSPVAKRDGARAGG